VNATDERVGLVPCACGRSSCDKLVDPSGGREYFDERHKQAAYRRRLKEEATAQGVPAAVSFATLNTPTDTRRHNGDAQTARGPVQRRRSGRQVSYSKAVRLLAAQLLLWDAAKTKDKALDLADTIMRDALPERQRKDVAS
jgi:hypothetical protein